MGLGVIRIVSDRGLGLGDRLRPLPLLEEYIRFRHMRGRIVRLRRRRRARPNPRRARCRFSDRRYGGSPPDRPKSARGRPSPGQVGGRWRARARKDRGGVFACLGGRPRYSSAHPRMERSTASGLFGRSRIARRASALTSSTPSELARRETNSTCNSPSLLRSPSNRSAQTCAPVSVEISWALT